MCSLEPGLTREWTQKYLKNSRDGLYIMNIDKVLVNYETGRFMLVEVKTHDGRVKPRQARTMRLLDAVIRAGMRVPGLFPRLKEYRGYHVVWMSGDNPTESDRIELNQEPITFDALIVFLNMED